MKSFLVIALFQVAACSLFSDEWHSFKAEHLKKYTSPREEQFRFGVYQKNKQMIEEHNKKFEAGLASYELRMNRFGDKLPEEVAFELTGFNRSGLAGVKRPASLTFNGYGRRVPASVDWREEGAVTPVKDQGSCGACWAFSATGSLEGQLFRKTGKLVSLSEQNLVDCAGEEYRNEGCNGGLMDNAFQYVIDNGGIDSERSYPYEGQENECRFRKSAGVGTISQYVDIPSGDEDALKEAVATVGPISVAINAMKPFMFYHRGIFSNEECYGEANSLNHGVLLVGYGSDDGQDYWIIKNSWNAHWGEEGYVRIARNTDNMCGVATMASYPIV